MNSEKWGKKGEEKQRQKIGVERKKRKQSKKKKKKKGKIQKTQRKKET